eukprot:gene23127-biopygen7255
MLATPLPAVTQDGASEAAAGGGGAQAWSWQCWGSDHLPAWENTTNGVQGPDYLEKYLEQDPLAKPPQAIFGLGWHGRGAGVARACPVHPGAECQPEPMPPSPLP